MMYQYIPVKSSSYKQLWLIGVPTNTLNLQTTNEDSVQTTHLMKCIYAWKGRRGTMRMGKQTLKGVALLFPWHLHCMHASKTSAMAGRQIFLFQWTLPLPIHGWLACSVCTNNTEWRLTLSGWEIVSTHFGQAMSHTLTVRSALALARIFLTALFHASPSTESSWPSQLAQSWMRWDFHYCYEYKLGSCEKCRVPRTCTWLYMPQFASIRSIHF